ncbi:MAG: hypothetical protein OXG53_06710 [Chloroflexi bacterium]|nr:hypothetical protein [Chloroflexota bacterium]
MEKQKVDKMSFYGAPLAANVGRCRTQLSIFQVIGHVVIWLIVSAITLGIGLLFWPYAAAKLILESIVIVDESGSASATLRCNLGFGEQIGHAVLWLILIALTGGIAGLCYLFGVAHFVLNRTELVSPSHR